MFRPPFLVSLLARLARCGSVAAVLVALGLSGCCQNCNLRGENFSDNALADQCRHYRTPDRQNELFGVSNKAQQIERDVGIQ